MEWTPPDWMYRDSKPNDNGYFENLKRIIFQGGINWRVIEKKWPYFKEAFKDFSIESVVKFTDDYVEKLMKNKGIVRKSSDAETFRDRFSGTFSAARSLDDRCRTESVR